MLNVIKSIIVTFITVIVSILSYIKGPIAIGLLVGASILAFAKKAEAALPPVMEDCGVALSCTYPSAVSLWEAMSFSQHMAVVLWVISCVLLFVLLHNSRKEKEARKSVFQVELDAAIKAYNNRTR